MRGLKRFDLSRRGHRGVMSANGNYGYGQGFPKRMQPPASAPPPVPRQTGKWGGTCPPVPHGSGATGRRSLTSQSQLVRGIIQQNEMGKKAMFVHLLTKTQADCQKLRLQRINTAPTSFKLGSMLIP